MKKYFALAIILFGLLINTGISQQKPEEEVITGQINPLVANLDRQLSELDAKPHLLCDSIIVFPLLDRNGKTTELGTFVSIIAMFRATYVPERIINNYFPEIEQEFYTMGYMQNGKKLTAKDIQSVMKKRRSEYRVTGSLTSGDKKFRITLKFEGPRGVKTFKKEDLNTRLPGLPAWIAENIHEYMGITLSANQKDYLKMPDFLNHESFLDFAGAEKIFWKRSTNRKDAEEILKTYEKLCTENPESAFLFSRRFNSAILNAVNPEDFTVSFLEKYPEHDRVNYHYAFWLYNKRDFSAMIPIALRLLERNYKTVQVYSWLANAFTSKGLLSQGEKIYNYWIKYDPQNFLAYLNRGNFYQRYAWDARGHGLAYKVSTEGWETFRKGSELAEKDIEQAFRLNPENSNVPAELISVGLNLGRNIDYINKWFETAVKLDPKNPSPYSRKMHYLKPQWYGSKKEMLSFAEESLDKLPESPVAYGLLEAFKDWDPGQEKKDIYNDPGVWKKIKSMFTLYLGKTKDTYNIHNLLAKYAVGNKDYEFAFDQFSAIGIHRDTSLWDPYGFHSAREETFRAMKPELTHEEYVLNTIEAYRKKLDSNTDDIETVTELAHFYYAVNNYDMAIPLLMKAQELDITNANVQSELGYIFYKQKRYNEAINIYRKAIVNYLTSSRYQQRPVHPNMALYRFLIVAKCYYGLGDMEKSVAACEEGLNIMSEYEYTHRSFYYSGYQQLSQFLGFLYYYKRKQPDKAIPYFEMSQKLEELANPYDLTHLGVISEEKGNLEKAAEYYKKALSLQNQGNEQNWEIKTAKTRLQKLTRRMQNNITENEKEDTVNELK